MRAGITGHVSIFARIYGFAVVLLFAFMCGIFAVLALIVAPANEAELDRIGVWVAGYLATEQDPARRSQMLESLRDEAGVAASIYDADGVRVQKNTERHPQQLESQWLGRARSQRQLRTMYDGRDLLIVHPPTDDATLVLEMIAPKSFVLGAWTLLSLLAALAIVAWPIARSLTVPMRKLQATMAAFGAGDIAVRAASSGHDEIGRLANTFNVMAERIARLVAAERLMVAGVAHELRTPLQRIRVALELATDDAGEDFPQRRYIESIALDVADLDRIISDILTVSALEISKAAPSQELLGHRERVSTDTLIRDCVMRFQAAHAQRPVVVQTEAWLPDVHVEPRLMHRAINNLLENAARYAPLETAIEVTAGTRDGLLRVTIRDHGPGIGSEHLPHIFAPFYRADQARARVSGGVGLGLTLVKAIVEAHGGSVSVESISGRGAAFTIALPLDHDHSRTPSTRSRSRELLVTSDHGSG